MTPARAPAGRRGVRAAVLAVALLVSGCFNGENGHGARASRWPAAAAPVPGAGTDEEVEALIEERLQGQLPPAPDEATQTLREVRLHRRQVAGEMAGEARSALAPLALVASLVAVDGPVDLLLNVFPAGKLGKAFHLGRDALRARKAGRLSKRKLQELAGALDAESEHFVRLAQHLGRAEVRALKRIHGHTGSQAVVTALLDKQVRGRADVGWIAAKLERGQVSPVFARRFTFDADLVEDITGYKAGIPWKTLQDVIEGKRVAAGARGALASKVVGLLGERAAAALVREPGFARKYLKRVDDAFAVSRGLPYTGGSLDLVATSLKDKVLYGEVKNWGPSTWQSAANRQKVLEQLRRHNRGIAGHLAETGRSSSDMAGRVLFVAEDGFRGGVEGGRFRKFDEELESLGWTIEYIPNDQIGTFRELIDDLR